LVRVSSSRFADTARLDELFDHMGLIQFRIGSIEEGRRLYQMAIIEARSRKDFALLVWALLHFAREEFQHNPNKAEGLIEEALTNNENLSPLGKAISSRLLQNIETV